MSPVEPLYGSALVLHTCQYLLTPLLLKAVLPALFTNLAVVMTVLPLELVIALVAAIVNVPEALMRISPDEVVTLLFTFISPPYMVIGPAIEIAFGNVIVAVLPEAPTVKPVNVLPKVKPVSDCVLVKLEL